MQRPVPDQPVRRAPLLWVDAFADAAFGGNPAAVCLLEEAADEGWMQSLAAEFGISETAFVVPDAAGGYGLRWFTPTTEVDLCGHATLASAHALAEWGRVGPDAEIAFHTRSGWLTARRSDWLFELDLPADPPEALGAPPDWATVLPGSPVVSAWAGQGTVAVELADADAVRAAAPDLAAVAALPSTVLYLTAPGDRDGIDYVLRVFGPRVGIDEDPVTGSAQCLLGPLWEGRLGRRVLEASQESRRGGRLRVTVAGDRVRVAGHAVTVLAGEVPLP
jgi:predicted PhzF superfamily epimerase YddE/YHI9